MTTNDRQINRRLPEWLKRPLPSGDKYSQVQKLLADLKLATVCDHAGCPNRGECYSHGTATFMIMGCVCTRNCGFCGVNHGRPTPLEADEPMRTALAVSALKLRHVVITSVTRDDLPDGGAEHFAKTIAAVRDRCPEVTIEVLTPDFGGDAGSLEVIYQARPDVFNHNIETVRRLTGEIRSGADYDRSLGVLRVLAEKANGPTVKSGLMVGLGESNPEIAEALGDLRGVGVKMVTIGQYLQPGPGNRPVQRFYPPEEFEQLRTNALAMGFSHVAAGPFVRSSYHAELSLREKGDKTKT
jgi:lipoyl synthase